MYRHQPTSTNKLHSYPPVSVIVCAKNEAENLRENIPKILQQIYPNFELVLINDRSTDQTGTIINEFASSHSNVKAIQVKKTDFFVGFKKYALTLGIKAASNNCLLFTDADCNPLHTEWIKQMVAQYNHTTQIVLGYSPYHHQKNSLLNKIIRYETLITAIQYFSYALHKFPYMGVGRNLMYDKNLFTQKKGFYDQIKIMSGDDDLLIKKLATSNNTDICIHPNSFTISPPKENIKTYVQQKRRHISTASHYKLTHQLLLGLFAFNRTLFWIVFPISFFVFKNNQTITILTFLTFIKFTSEYFVIYKSAKKLNEKNITLLAPFLDFLLLCFQLFIFVYNICSKPKKWI